jgi:hypothetical protein
LQATAFAFVPAVLQSAADAGAISARAKPAAAVLKGGTITHFLLASVINVSCCMWWCLQSAVDAGAISACAKPAAAVLAVAPLVNTNTATHRFTHNNDQSL